MPDLILYQTTLDIHVQHLNYGGHLGNDSLISLIHEARMRFLTWLGVSEIDVGGTALIMTDSVVVYQSEGFYANRLLIKIGVKDVTPKSFDLYYEVINETTEKPLALVKTGMLGFDYVLRKTKTLPESFVSRLQ